MKHNRMEMGKPRLFLKPNPEGGIIPSSIEPPPSSITFRSLDLASDLPVLHDWVNRAYARQFWQLEGSIQLLEKTYAAMLDNPQAHSFVGCLGDQLICQVDVYHIAADELSRFIDYHQGDTGLHFLGAPPRQEPKGMSLAALKAFQRFYFSYPQAQRLFAEPDQDNGLANILAKRAGFQFIKSVQLSYKLANLYCLTRDQFKSTTH